MTSEAWADLGGGIRDYQPRPRRVTRTLDPTKHEHEFSSLSGWCYCGLRDDGAICEGTPAAKQRTQREEPT